MHLNEVNTCHVAQTPAWRDGVLTHLGQVVFVSC
jgi:hypothetical protein